MSLLLQKPLTESKTTTKRSVDINLPAIVKAEDTVDYEEVVDGVITESVTQNGFTVFEAVPK